MTRERNSSPSPLELDDADYIEIWSRLDDATIAAIDRTGATLAECEQAMLWAFGDADALQTSGQPPAGVIARVYDILTTALADGNDDCE